MKHFRLIIIWLFFFTFYCKGQSIAFENKYVVKSEFPFQVYSSDLSISKVDSTLLFCYTHLKVNRKPVILQMGAINIFSYSNKKFKSQFLKIPVELLDKRFDISQGCMFGINKQRLCFIWGNHLMIYNYSNLLDTLYVANTINLRNKIKTTDASFYYLGSKENNLYFQVLRDTFVYCLNLETSKLKKTEISLPGSEMNQFGTYGNIAINYPFLIYTKYFTNQSYIYDLRYKKLKSVFTVDSLWFNDTIHKYNLNLFMSKTKRQSRIVNTFFLNDSIFCTRFFINNGISKPYYANYFYILNYKGLQKYFYSEVDYYWLHPDRLEKPCNNDIYPYYGEVITLNGVIYIVRDKYYFSMNTNETLSECLKHSIDGFFTLERFNIKIIF